MFMRWCERAPDPAAAGEGLHSQQEKAKVHMETLYEVEAQYEAGQGCQTAEARILALDPDDACSFMQARIVEGTGARPDHITIVRCRPVATAGGAA